MIALIKNVIEEFAEDPKNARNTLVWGRNRFHLSFDSCTREITICNAITWDFVAESSNTNLLAHAIHSYRR